MAMHKRFGGKLYTYLRSVKTKAEAQKIAEAHRKKGGFATLESTSTRSGKRWVVWARGAGADKPTGDFVFDPGTGKIVHRGGR